MKKIIWTEPSFEYEIGEFERVSRELGIPMSILKKLFHLGHLVSVSAKDLRHLDNTEFNIVHTMDDVRDWIHGRDLDKIEKGLASGSERAPIVLRYGDYFHLVAGNTRLCVAKVLGYNLSVYMMEAEIKTQCEVCSGKTTISDRFCRTCGKEFTNSLTDRTLDVVGEPYDYEQDPDESALWHVSLGNKHYEIEVHGDRYTCSCKAFEFRRRCKHVDALRKELLAEKPKKERFKRQEITELLEVMDREVLYDIEYTVAGSYRRGLPTSKDLDIVVQGFHKPEIKARLEELYPTGGDMRPGDKVAPAGKSSGDFIHTWYVPLGTSEILMDFQFTDPEAYEPMLLFFTGSQQFNIKMRAKAKEMGYALNQYGLWDREDRSLLIARSEKDIFRALGMVYVPPTQRNL